MTGTELVFVLFFGDSSLALTSIEPGGFCLGFFMSGINHWLTGSGSAFKKTLETRPPLRVSSDRLGCH